MLLTLLNYHPIFIGLLYLLDNSKGIPIKVYFKKVTPIKVYFKKVSPIKISLEKISFKKIF